MADQAVADIGLIGLAVMGENLALNIRGSWIQSRSVQPYD